MLVGQALQEHAAGWASRRCLRSLRWGRDPGSAAREAGGDVWAGMGKEGSVVGEAQGAASAFGEAELPGHVSPSALASLPGHRASPRGTGRGVGEGRRASPTSQAGGTHAMAPAHVAAQPRDSAGERPDGAHPTLPRPNSTPAPSVPSVLPRELPKRSPYHGVPAQRTISAPPLSNEGTPQCNKHIVELLPMTLYSPQAPIAHQVGQQRENWPWAMVLSSMRCRQPGRSARSRQGCPGCRSEA